MIIQEYFQLDPNDWILVKTYSDRGMFIQQDKTGDLYVEAIDPDFMNQTYTETNKPIEIQNDIEGNDMSG